MEASHQSRIDAVKSAFTRLTGRKLLPSLGYQMAQDTTVAQWLDCGFTVADLELVVGHIRKQYSGEYRDGLLRWKTLLETPQRFQELVEDARRAVRSAPPPKTLRDTAQKAMGFQTDREKAMEREPVTPRDVTAKLFHGLAEKLKKGEPL